MDNTGFAAAPIWMGLLKESENFIRVLYGMPLHRSSQSGWVL